jgi:hypothetical protein
VAEIDNINTTLTNIATRSGNQLVVNDNSSTQTVGNFVTDVSIQPYIAPTIIAFYAYNLRPNTIVHVFFDSVLVDQYCAPGYAEGGVITDTSNYQSITQSSPYGTPIKTDVFGTVAGWFNVPAATFKTGDRVLTIADTENLTLSADAITTKASATFTASNLSVTKQSVTLTTITPEISVVPVSQTVVTSTTTTNIVVHPDTATITGSWYEPIAQGLTINTPNGEAGVFVTSIDLFFKQKPSTGQNGVTVYICEINNGYPDGTNVIPFSTVHLSWADVAININGVATYNGGRHVWVSGPGGGGYSQDVYSTDDSVQFPTNFKFQAPVFLNNGTEYAIVIKPDAGDPDYWVYSANLGDTDLVTGTQIYSQPVIGTAFYGATTGEWTALQTEYIKFELYRAEFTAQSGDAYFNNAPTDFINVYNVGYACTTSTILPGDYVFQSTNSYINATGGTTNTQISGIIEYYDDVKEIIYVANSTGNWPTTANNLQIHRFANATVLASPGPNNVTQIAFANTLGLYNPIMNSFVPQLATIAPSGTVLNVSYSGTNNNYTLDSNEYAVTPGTETDFYDYERIVASRTNEVLNMSGKSSLTVHTNLVTDSSLLSPVVDTVRHQELLISNDVDPISFIYEEFFNDGSSKSKYVSEIVTLAPGQDAEDLQVILTAWRPPGTDIQVWVKFLNGQDSDPISAKTWTPLINQSVTLYSDPGNPSNQNEYTFGIAPYYNLIPTTGTITTTSSCTAIVGTGTLFQKELKPGWFINMAATPTTNETTRKVVSITDNTHLTIDSSFNYTYTANAYFLSVPPTTPWLSANTQTQISGNVSTSSTTNIVTGFAQTFNANTTAVNNSSNSILISTANSLFSVGQRIYYYVPAGNTALTGLTGNTYYFIATANTSAITLNSQQGNTTPITITASTTTPAQVHSLNSTYFDIQVQPGNILDIAGDQQTVVAVANGTSLTVGKPWSSTVNGANAYILTPNGLSYLNSSAALYSTFLKFQIKVIVQSNDSSKPPILNDVRAIALQL